MTNEQSTLRQGSKIAKELDGPAGFNKWKLQLELHFGLEQETEDIFSGHVQIEEDEDNPSPNAVKVLKGENPRPPLCSS